MDLFEFWHPRLLVFAGLTLLPVFLIFKWIKLGQINHGYFQIIAGLVLISLSAFVDYAVKVPFFITIISSFMNISSISDNLPYFYCSGILLTSMGIIAWFPTIQSIYAEIERRKIVEEELRDLANKLNLSIHKEEEANQAKSEFLASMSHELRTPLNAVIGYSDFMINSAKGALSEKKKEEYLHHIHESGSHLLSIINEILDLSKLEAGKYEVSIQAFEIRTLVDECISFCRPTIIHKNLDIIINLDAIELHNDNRIIKQVILNILANAVKFTFDYGRITFKGIKISSAYELCITDTGIGMDEKELQLALQPFSQVQETYNRTHQGTGLGLTLVKRFLDRIGGVYEITSEKGVGTKVTMIFPDFSNNILQEKDIKSLPEQSRKIFN